MFGKHAVDALQKPYEAGRSRVHHVVPAQYFHLLPGFFEQLHGIAVRVLKQLGKLAVFAAVALNELRPVPDHAHQRAFLGVVHRGVEVFDGAHGKLGKLRHAHLFVGAAFQGEAVYVGSEDNAGVAPRAFQRRLGNGFEHMVETPHRGGGINHRAQRCGEVGARIAVGDRENVDQVQVFDVGVYFPGAGGKPTENVVTVCVLHILPFVHQIASHRVSSGGSLYCLSL